MKVNIYTRNSFTDPVLVDDLRINVNSMSWSRFGGPEAASVSLRGNMTDLWECLNWMRGPIVIMDERGAAVWWGYISECQVRSGTLEVKASMDLVANRVAVAYSYVAAGTTTVGERKTTAWAEDAESIAEFGTKEFLSSQSGMSDAAAEARRDAIVAAKRYPQAITSGGMVPRGRLVGSGAENSQSATLYCKGWWSTLGWRYASVASGDVVTTAQIVSLIGAYGQFLSTVYVDAASGVSASAYRDGDTTALDEIESLMLVGGAGGRDLVSWVDDQRRVHIFEEEAAAACALYMDGNGMLLNSFGSEVIDLGQLCGRWLKLRDVIPGNVDLTKMINPGLQFIEGVSWKDDSVSMQFRGGVSIEDMMLV